MGLTTFQLALSIVNLVGSLTSALGTAAIIISFFVLPRKHHFRHLLIFNLAVADFMNSLNNSVSGLWVLSHKKPLSASTACVVNGFFSQVSVQATDCTILAIAAITVYTITNVKQLLKNRTSNIRMALLLCAASWALPLITSFFALGKELYGPVSGNWCWLKAQPTYMRYVLTHGWRFAFIFTEIGLYAYLYIYMRRIRREPLQASSGSSYIPMASPVKVVPQLPSSPSSVATSEKYSATSSSDSSSRDVKTLTPVRTDFSTDGSRPSTTTEKRNISRYTFSNDRSRTRTQISVADRKVQKVLLLNAYPIAYIILWLPGIANRLAEATGHPSKPLQILQASTQFVGLANALTYGMQTLRRK